MNSLKMAEEAGPGPGLFRLNASLLPIPFFHKFLYGRRHYTAPDETIPLKI